MAGVSLIAALVALRISNRVARMSISMPSVIEKLHDLYAYWKTRQLDDDPPSARSLGLFVAVLTIVNKLFTIEA